ncbi:MAG TPA: hypothetical protein VK419_16645 [Bryobacteraceae bacterium]|nr:hypothetical protein [Bryobacteraceae bacterium]
MQAEARLPVWPVEAADLDRRGSEFILQVSFEIPIGARFATEDIQTKRAMLGESVAGDVGFLKKGESGDASAGKLVPLRFGDGMKIHSMDEIGEQIAQRLGIGERGRVTLMRFHDPLTT